MIDHNEYIATYGTLGQKEELTEKIKRQREREGNMEFYGTIALVFLAGATFGIFLLGQLVMSSI